MSRKRLVFLITTLFVVCYVSYSAVTLGGSLFAARSLVESPSVAALYSLEDWCSAARLASFPGPPRVAADACANAAGSLARGDIAAALPALQELPSVPGFSNELDRARSLAQGDIVRALGSVLHPETLVLVTNSGEGRPGNGMVLAAGTPASGIRSVLDLPPVPRSAGSEASEVYFWRKPAWTELGLSFDFQNTARIASDWWSLVTGRRPDSVVLVDQRLPVLLLEQTGAQVEAGGRQWTAEVLDPWLKVDQYRRDDAHTDARRNETFGLTLEVVARTLRQANPGDIGVALDRAVAQGYLRAWSDDPSEAGALAAAGFASALPANALSLSSLSNSATKIDHFLELRVASMHEREVLVTLTNRAPGGLPPYVAGPCKVDGSCPPVVAAQGYGAAFHNVVLRLPQGAGPTPPSVTGAALASYGPDGSGWQVVLWPGPVLPGGSAQIRVTTQGPLAQACVSGSMAWRGSHYPADMPQC